LSFYRLTKLQSNCAFALISRENEAKDDTGQQVIDKVCKLQKEEPGESCDEDDDSYDYSQWRMTFPGGQGNVYLRSNYGYIADCYCDYDYIYCPDGDYYSGGTSCEVTERFSSFANDDMFKACKSTMQQAGTERGAN